MTLALAAPFAPASVAQDSGVPIIVHEPILRLGDLIDVRSIPAQLRETAMQLDILRLGAPERPVQLSADRLTHRIRGLMPVLGDWAMTHIRASYTVIYRPTGNLFNSTSSACLRSLKNIESGAMARSVDFAPASCANLAPGAWFSWNSAARSAISRRALEVGVTVPRFPGYADTRVYAGDRLAIQTQVGPVTVQRAVTAIQSARAGERLLVRTDDGTILSGPVEDR